MNEGKLIEIVDDARFIIKSARDEVAGDTSVKTVTVYPGKIHRLPRFSKSSKVRVDLAFKLLLNTGIAGEPQKEYLPAGGRPKDAVSIDLEKAEMNDEQLNTNLCCSILDDALQAAELAQRKLALLPGIYYEPVPALMEKALTTLHPLEAEDTLDAYMLWRSAVDDLEYEASPVQARKVRLDIIHARATHFRKHPRSRVDVAAQLLASKSVCSLGDNADCIIIPDEFLPRSHWAEGSPTRLYFTQEFEEAQKRVMSALGAEIDIAPFPDGPLEAIPESVKVKYDFRFMYLGGVCLTLRKGDIVSEPCMVRHLLNGGFPVCSVEECIFEYCKHCGTKNPKPEEDTSEEIRFLRPKRNYTAFFTPPLSGQMLCSQETLIDTPGVVDWFLRSGWPVQSVKEHEFVKCNTCHKVTFLTTIQDS